MTPPSDAGYACLIINARMPQGVYGTLTGSPARRSRPVTAQQRQRAGDRSLRLPPLLAISNADPKNYPERPISRHLLGAFDEVSAKKRSASGGTRGWSCVRIALGRPEILRFARDRHPLRGRRPTRAVLACVAVSRCLRDPSIPHIRSGPPMRMPSHKAEQSLRWGLCPDRLMATGHPSPQAAQDRRHCVSASCASSARLSNQSLLATTLSANKKALSQSQEMLSMGIVSGSPYGDRPSFAASGSGPPCGRPTNACVCCRTQWVRMYTRPPTKMPPQGGRFCWRRGWDSNPRAGRTRPSDFESAPL